MAALFLFAVATGRGLESEMRRRSAHMRGARWQLSHRILGVCLRDVAPGSGLVVREYVESAERQFRLAARPLSGVPGRVRAPVN